MPRTSLLVLVALLVAIPCVTFAQEKLEPVAPAKPAVEKPERKVDPAAQKLLDAAIKSAYSAVGAGLEEMTCDAVLNHPQVPIPTSWQVKFAAPDTSSAVVVKLPPEAAGAKARLEQALSKTVTNMLCETLKGPFSDHEDYNIAMKEGTENVVVQTRFKADSESLRVELTFDEKGMLTRIVNEMPQARTVIEPVFEKKGDRYVMVSGTLDLGAGPMDLAIDYVQVGKFWLTHKVSVTSPMGNLSLSTSNHKVKPAAVETPTEKPADKK